VVIVAPGDASEATGDGTVVVAANALQKTRKKTRALSMLPETLATLTAVVENCPTTDVPPERRKTRALSMNPIAQAAAAAAREAVAATKNRAAYAYHVVNYKTHPELAYQRHLAGKLTTARPGEILAARRKENLIRLKKLREQQQAEEELLSEKEAASVDPRERKHIHFAAVVAGLMSET
jgi:hypothetical protein